MQSQVRFHYMDNLRAIALLMGVFYHAALAYSPFMVNIWFTADPLNHPIFEVMTHWLHLFRMPVFFIIAGFFASLLLNNHGVKSFLKHRAKRILFPFIIFIPILAALFLHALKWGAQFPDTLPAIYTLFEQVENMPASSMHLWFLWNLMGFSLLLALFMHFNNKMCFVFTMFAYKWILLFVLPLIITPALYTQYAPFPAPDKFTIQAWSYGFYGVMFLVGASIYLNQSVIKQLTPFTPYLFLVGIISFILFLELIPPALSIQDVIEYTVKGKLDVSGTKHLILVLAQNISLVYWSLISLIMAQKYLNQENTITRYISDASYWVYLMHMPVLIYIQMPLLSINLPILIKLFIALFVTFTLCFASYHLFVRKTLIGRLLNGQKVTRRCQKLSV